MKNIIIVILLVSLKSLSQNPIFDIEDYQNRVHDISGCYIKDTNNLLNNFEGVYVYNQNGIYFKIVLQKKELSSFNGFYFEDLLIGEYQYILNGVEKVNTLNKLNDNYSNKRYHSIDTNMILTGTELCEECNPNEKHLHGGLTDGNSIHTAEISIRRTLINGQQAIIVWVGWRMTASSPTNPKTPASFPGGIYTLIKQP